MIVLTTTLSDFIAIFKTLCIYWKTIIQSPYTHPHVGEVHGVWYKNSPHLAYSYSPCSAKFLHTISKHWNHLAVIKSRTVLMKQHVSDIRVSMLKSGKTHVALSIKITYTFRSIKFINIFTHIIPQKNYLFYSRYPYIIYDNTRIRRL